MPTRSGIDYSNKGYLDLTASNKHDKRNDGREAKGQEAKTCADCNNLRQELQEKQIELENERKQRIKAEEVVSELNEKLTLISKEHSQLKISLDSKEMIPQSVAEKDNCKGCDSLKKELRTVQLDLDSEIKKRQSAEKSASKLYEQKKAIKRELELEKTWRENNQNTMKELISKLPSYEEKNGTGQDEQLQKTVELKEHHTAEAAVHMEVPSLQDEVDLLKLSQDSLLQKTIELKKQHTAEAAVLEEFRTWVESEKFSRMMRFKQLKSCQIEEALENKVKLGSGAFGTVFKTFLAGKAVAIKLLDQSSNQGSREFDSEVDLLGKTHHPNIVNLIGSCKDIGALVYEFLENGTLEKRLEAKGEDKLSWKKRIVTAFGLCSVLIFLHNLKPNPIVHGDLKPDNILFDAEDTPKIGDFGIAYELEHVSDTGTFHHVTGGTPRGTSSYVDPEFTATGKLTPAADIYAFGVILLQLVTGTGAPGLVDQIKHKLVICKKLENKSLAVQKRVLKTMGLIDSRLDQDEWKPSDVMMLLRLGVECAQPERKSRPSLSGSVWHELKAAIEE